ncbi:helix-turn-helix transcriptional regulator [Enterococcus montenegrensis]|uniref:helix-turn-helix transcriptional regulator n=1 Tax=Enterococcus montenegrensis TaxID=3031993 RepID=UPI00249ED412|nr:helix-turn-helix transcriptional regulator [Enterococcus montenegrensis]WHA10369.1 helix-turn-helix transcriptional regulator [Enterococcus montenegrensis]
MIEQLKQIREMNQLTAQDVAEKVGITKGYYSMIENGKRGLSYPIAVKIAEVFDMKPDDIFFTHEFTNEKHFGKEAAK